MENRGELVLFGQLRHGQFCGIDLVAMIRACHARYAGASPAFRTILLIDG